MSLNTNFNVTPYYDDFDEDKKFLRLLFKPGYAVQARELTQLQTLLQNQVERFGNHMFKNGSLVTGGQTFLQDATFLKLDTDFSGSAVVANNFVGLTILSTDATKRGEVITAFDADPGTGDPKTLLIKQLYGPAFVPGETITTVENAPAFANIATSGVGTGQIFSVNEGVFYYDGFFIKNSPQTIATSKYNNTTANARIGFEITESTVISTQDTSLLDPAQDASNFQAPGSDRYKIDLVLTTRSLTSTDDTQFIELARVEEGSLTYYVKYPLYAVLEETLARRTFDESGNYTVRPFKIALDTSTANSAKANVVLSPGKAYVYGFEFETIAPTTITFDKPRTTESVNNKRITADYGYFVYSNTHFGSFPINSLQTVDLHCVSNSTINVASTNTISNTKIGTARVKTIAFETASDTSNSATYGYRTYLFDVDVGSILGGNCNNGIVTSNTTYIQLANTLSGSLLYSTVNNAYRGAKFRVAAGNGVGETPKTILNYNGTTQTIEISESFIANVNSSSTWAIDFEFNDVKSLAVTSGTSRLAAADIAPESKDPASTFNDTYIVDRTFEPLIFELGQSYIAANTITDFSHSYKRLYEAQAFSSSISPTLSVGSGETIATASSTSAKNDNYYVVVTSAGTSPYKNGEVISADKFTVDSGLRKITVTSGNNMTANIIATVDVSNPSPKTKTFVAANTTIQTSGGVDIFGNSALTIFASAGQTHISKGFVNKIPNNAQSLHVPDVIDIERILDFNNLSITTANVSSATDITSRYTLDNGQRDSFYDHSSIKLKPGASTPTGPLAVFYDRFNSSGAGFFHVDSYSGYSYGDIPSYTSDASGKVYELRDSLDYRPVRTISTTVTANTISFDVDPTTTGPKIAENGSDIILDYQYYLPRIDKVILNKNRTFEVVQGVPSLTPVEPKDKDGSMTLYILREPAFLDSTAEVLIQYTDNRRFTMKDIGTISKRVENLEYYTSLSLLEQSAVNKQDLTILDSTNLPRFKNGIVVDAFNGHSVADVSNADYEASIDPNRKELRPSFNISSHLLTFDSANSTNFIQAGPLITTTSTQSALIDQPKTSRAINVNPFNVINYLGKIQLDPASDIWIDTDKQPDVLINLGGDKDAWNLITQNVFNYEWGDWSTYWTGRQTNSSTWNQQDWVGGEGMRRVNQTTTTTTTNNQVRSGIITQVVPETITQALGDRVIDISIIPYMRSRGVLFVGTDFKPNTTLFPFFDSTSIEKFVAQANKFILSSNNLTYRTSTANPEVVSIIDNTTSTTNGTALIVATANNEAYVVSINSSNSAFILANSSLIGATTGTSKRIIGYEHYSGNVFSATANTVVLRVDATSANNISTYVGSPIFIVAGQGAGQQATISAYTEGTRTATISGTWTTTPAANSIYSIGRLNTSASGQIAGVFFVPTATFRVGEKNFRLIDVSTGDIPSSTTNGDATFFSQGILQKTEDTIISTTVPTIQRAAVNDTRVLTQTTSTDQVVGYWDPLAQTFLISPINYPQGIFLSKVRFCFKSKDDRIPVTLQVRPALNGYPSSAVIYPYSTVSLTPDLVKTTSSPDLDDATKFTEFEFDAPVFLQPGEHSFVLLANSNKYEVYIAEIGKLDTVSGRQISEQPYGGSLFLSQNGSTWSADQNSDMMFRLFRYTFNTGTTTAQFVIDKPTANVVYDLLHLITSDISIGNTGLSYQFSSVKASDGTSVGLKSITPLNDYEMTDGSDRRVITSTANNSLVVKATMFTNNSDVSPFLDVTRFGVIAVENKINDLPLANADFILSNGGSGYANSADVTVTITGGGGSSATASATVASNVITAITLTNSGSGYETSPTVTITAGSGGGSGAVVTYNGENSKSGGNSAVRYQTRKVTLADGFDSGDLRVYLTTYKPAGSDVRVYYKLLSVSDPDVFDDKSWQLMTPLSNINFISNNQDDYREIAYAPGLNNSANNSVTYASGTTGYNTFRTFAIKLVLTGTSTTDVPKVRDFRAIALPAGS